jgi:hypothetical protein
MNDGFLRDVTGKIIRRFDGAWLRDGTVRLVAWYDQSDNQTYDRNGRIVGDGDLRLFQLGFRGPTKGSITVTECDKNGSDNSSTADR